MARLKSLLNAQTFVYLLINAWTECDIHKSCAISEKNLILLRSLAISSNLQPNFVYLQFISFTLSRINKKVDFFFACSGIRDIVGEAMCSLAIHVPFCGCICFWSFEARSPTFWKMHFSHRNRAINLFIYLFDQ